MHALKIFLAILSATVPLQAIQTLLPPSQMHPIEPANLDWHMKVYTPPHQYEVHLKPGYTIEQHFETIGKDLGSQIRRRWEDPEDFEYAQFIIYLPDQADLNLIRRDPRVTFVAQDAEYQAINDLMEESEAPKVAKHDEL
ncbi:unnamed protein product [Aureobasidium vineae]|uniref:Uncharacterized protein n=1 Tax=Aureobasidium vineae TaxID=2773715 RepID=A0A9N8JBK4_9PEZI|nr:unnamed protein product [Aureobasidium vineae]